MTATTRAAAVLGCVTLAVLPACAPSARELARGPAGSRGTSQLLEALAARFGPVSREPAFDALRPKLATAALVPSRVFDDPGAWTARTGDSRGVELAGAGDGPTYRIGVRPAAPDPSAPGDYRGRLQLRRLADGRFEWQLHEELALGAVRPVELAAALSALFREAERQAGTAAPRDLVAAALPRAAAVVGQACRLERLQLARDASATQVEAIVRLTPEGLSRAAPRYAAFLRRYVSPMKLHATAADASGATWWTLDGSDSSWTLRLRVRDGSLVPLAGAASGGIPSELRVTIDYQTRMGRFTVGVRSLVAELTLTRAAHEKGFRARFVQEPDWQLPFLVAPLIRGSLRYPFEAEGSEAGWSVREQPGGGGGRAVRSYRARVRESWLVRWLGGLTTNAVDDFRRGAEAEADAYHRACLLALRDDLVALSTP